MLTGRFLTLIVPCFLKQLCLIRILNKSREISNETSYFLYKRLANHILSLSLPMNKWYGKLL